MNIIRTSKNYDKAPHIKAHVVADSDPTVDQDVKQNYDVGSTWYNQTSKTSFVCTSATAGAAVWIQTNAAGIQRKYIEEVVTLTAASSVNLSTQLPAGAIPHSAQLNYETTHGGYTNGGGTPVKTGFGTVADPDGYALSPTDTTKNTKTTGKGALCGIVVAAATTMCLTACNTSGALGNAGDQFISGQVRARIYYDIMTALPDAA